MYLNFKMLSGVNSEGHLPSGQSTASDSGPHSLSAGLTAQESPWSGLLSRPSRSLLRLLPAGSRNLTDRVPVHHHLEDVTPCEKDRMSGLPWLSGGSLQELGIRAEPVPELQQRGPAGSVSGVRTAVSHLLLGCVDRPGTVWSSGLRGGPVGFRAGMWTRTEPLESEAAEPEKPSELLSMWTPPNHSQDGPTPPEPERSPEEENLPDAPTPPQNKAIAFIMGFPCSDEDDGFDSEGSSSFSSSDEDDEDEGSERVLHSLCLTSDPYNPRCFMAPLHTGPTPTGPSDLRASVPVLPVAPPPYSGEGAAERLDSGFSELRLSSRKVRFSDDVEEIACEVEDRRGQWEELARDRLRFQRRCQEVELEIAPCLQPQHRQQVYGRFHGDSEPESSV